VAKGTFRQHQSVLQVNFYVVLSGLVKVSAFNNASRAALNAMLIAGEILLSTLLYDSIHSYLCDAFTNCAVAQIGARIFCEIVLRVPFNSFTFILQLRPWSFMAGTASVALAGDALMC
jgi:hypothetical protein